MRNLLSVSCRMTLTLAACIPALMAQQAGSFSRTGDMVVSRYGHQAILLLDGRVLILGGIGAGDAICGCTMLASAEIYDPATGNFTATGSMNVVRQQFSAVLLKDGRVLVSGGLHWDDNTPVSSAEIFDPATGVFQPTGSLVIALRAHTSTLLADGTVLIAGGYRDGTVLINGEYRFSAGIAPAEIYDPVSGTFRELAESGWATFATATSLTDGRIFLTGTSKLLETTVTEIYDPKKEAFSHTGSLTGFQRYLGGYCTTALANGDVLLAGGTDDPEESSTNLATARLYNPGTGFFSVVNPMDAGRQSPTGTLLPDGTVLIAGGFVIGPGGFDFGTFSALASAEIYDPASATFTPTASMMNSRSGHTATLLRDGTVLIAGGVYHLNTAELYIPAH